MKKILLFLVLGCSFTVLAAPPANDDCAGAITIATDGSCKAGTTVNSTPSFAANMGTLAGCGGAAQGDDVWYKFTAAANQWSFSLTTATSGPIGVLLLDGICGSGTFTTLSSNCVNGTSLSGSYGSCIPGHTYYVLVITKSTKDRTFSLCTTVAAATGGSGTNLNCTTSTPLCSSTTQTGTSSGYGSQDLNGTNSGCLSTEHQSAWYTFTALTTGTFNMDIATNGIDDYDFALWGPNPPCPPTSAPARCSYAAGATGGHTGIHNTGSASDFSEDASGDGWVNTLDVVAGETYVFVIDNFSSTTTPYNVSFSGSASLDCAVVLPIELKSFDAKATYANNVINWVTGSERLSDYFILETSTDGYEFKQLTTVKGAGNSNEDQFYSFTQQNPEKRINYYRLTEVDINGARTTFNMISVDNENAVQLIKTVNLCGQEVNKDTKGIVFEYYSDGTVTKVYHN